MKKRATNSSSRKLELAYRAIFALVFCWASTHFFPFLEASFAALATAIVGVVTVYCGGNVAQKATTKAEGPVEPGPQE